MTIAGPPYWPQRTRRMKTLEELSDDHPTGASSARQKNRKYRTVSLRRRAVLASARSCRQSPDHLQVALRPLRDHTADIGDLSKSPALCGHDTPVLHRMDVSGELRLT